MANQDGFYVQLGLLVRKARVDAKLTQQELSDALSISRTSLTNIEKGHQRLLVHTLVELGGALDIDPARLIPIQVPRTAKGQATQLPKVKAKKERDFMASILTRAGKRKL